ncbi:MAG: ABC transporter ATP-binding protein [Candidatus Jettenia sp. CY-1]|nr:MAG: ABC transporter ATP-binding protein [Candidatus Jettenia sp. CY-1]
MIAISACNLNFWYGQKKVIHNISTDISEGEFVGVLGCNGSGKTTFLKILAGLLPCREGTVTIFNQPLNGISIKERAKIIGYLSQFHSPVFPFTVEDVVLTARASHVFSLPSKKDHDRTTEALKQIGLQEIRKKPYTELSGGERQLTMIARILAQDPKVLILDEPVNHLDIRNQLEIMTLLKRITRDLNLTTVLVLHDLNVAMRYADRFIFLKDGYLYLSGGREMINAETMKKVYRIDTVIEEIKGMTFVIPGIT